MPQDIPDQQPINERVSVLETRMDYHDIALQQSLDRITNVADNLAVQVDRTNTILERFEEKLSNALSKISEWDTVIKTLSKVIVIGSILIGAAWSVYTFWVARSPNVTITATTK